MEKMEKIMEMEWQQKPHFGNRECRRLHETTKKKLNDA